MNMLNKIKHRWFMKSIFSGFAIFLVLHTLCLCAASPAASKRDENIAISNGFAKTYNDIKTKIKDKKILSLDLLAYSKSFSLYYNMPSIEDSTKISRDFFKKSSDYLKKLSDYKTIIEVYEENNKKNNPKCVEAKKAYEPLLKEFEKYFNDPPAVKPGK